MSTESSALIAELNLLASAVSFRRGTTLFCSGDSVSGVYVVRTGAVTLSLATPGGLVPPRRLGPGEIAGLPATLTGSYSLSAQVTEDAELAFVPARLVTELFERSPRLCLVAMRLISAEIARMRNALRNTPALDWMD